MMLALGRSRLRASADEEPGFWTSCESRGETLLRDWLSPRQAKQYAAFRFFDVVGSDTGKRYRIYRGRMMNVAELDAEGHIERQWCFGPERAVAIGDVMLAQKIALEGFETEALAIARGAPNPGPFSIILCQVGLLIVMIALLAMLMWSCAQV
jgi:hypothetical protein